MKSTLLQRLSLVLWAIGAVANLPAQRAVQDSSVYYAKVESDGVGRMRYPTGHVYGQGTLDHRGGRQRQQGEWVFFRNNGEVDRVMSYNDGELDGISYFYDGARIFRIDYYEKNKLIKRVLIPADLPVSP